MIQVLCVEDDPSMLKLLQMRLGEETDIQVVGAVNDLERARIYLHRQPVDIILLDRYLHGRDTTHLLTSMQPWQAGESEAPAGPAILFCTGLADADFTAQARLLGARGIVAKERLAEDLMPALRAIAAGETWFGSPTP
jgi:DNA-binding NarL/FixJ family response regulator